MLVVCAITIVQTIALGKYKQFSNVTNLFRAIKLWWGKTLFHKQTLATACKLSDFVDMGFGIDHRTLACKLD